MAGDEQFQTGDPTRRRRRHDENSLGAVIGSENFGQALGHRGGRFAERDDAQRRKFPEVQFPALDNETAALAIDGGADGAASVDG